VGSGAVEPITFTWNCATLATCYPEFTTGYNLNSVWTKRSEFGAWAIGESPCSVKYSDCVSGVSPVRLSYIVCM
jgi:hypothetical protein